MILFQRPLNFSGLRLSKTDAGLLSRYTPLSLGVLLNDIAIEHTVVVVDTILDLRFEANPMNSLVKKIHSSLFWWAVFGASTFSMLVALYFQYALEEGPCALCIHIRIYMAGLMLVGLAGILAKPPIARLLLNWICAGLCVGLAFKSWELFGVERGFIDASCTIGAGLPQWFNLEDWFPTLFASWGLCGITPDVLFGISMAEALMPTSIAAAIASVLLAIAALVTIKSALKDR